MADREREEFAPTETARTYVHQLLEEMDFLGREELTLVDLSTHPVMAPGYGVLIGENEYAVGSGKQNPDARFLVTQHILHCTGISITDQERERSVLAHLFTTRDTEALFGRFIEQLAPRNGFSITIIPGYQVTYASRERLRDVLAVSQTLRPQTLTLDIANGDPRAFRGILTDTLSGNVSELAVPIEGAQTQAYIQSGKSIF